MSSIECKIIDIDLLSGSADSLRAAIGGYWAYVYSSDDEVELEFNQIPPTQTLSPYIQNIKRNVSKLETLDENVFIPNFRIPVRINGISDTDAVLSDEHWKTLFVGGIYNDERLTPLYSENLFNYHQAEFAKPYPMIDAAKIEQAGDSVTDKIQISYEYNNYIPRYQEYISNAQSVLTLPNYYVLADMQGQNPLAALKAYGAPLVDSVTLNGNYPGSDCIFKLNKTALQQIGIDPAHAGADLLQELNKSYTFLSTDYLSNAYIRNTLSASTQNYLNDKLKNVFLDSDAIERLYDEKLVGSEYTRTKFPFYTKTTFPLPSTGSFFQYINDSKYSSKFLKTLKESFNNELSSKKMIPLDKTYAVNLSYLSSSQDTTENTETQEATSKNYRTIDFMSMLAYMHNNYDSKTEDCLFVGSKNIYRNSATTGSGSYRYINSLGSLKLINNTIGFLSNLSNYNAEEPLMDLIFGNNDSYTETLAYRIEKIGGAPTGDLRKQKSLQDYWMMNTDVVDEMTFIDTQVKYGEYYTYRVYAYVLTIGSKYNYSDLSVSQHLCDLEDGDDQQGLELYDPFTGTPMDTLFPLSTLTGTNTTDSQIRSEYSYVAEMYLNYEPSVQILEIPLYTKTLKILDHPANSTDVTPYQHIDASQKIGFGLYYDSFFKRSLPMPISTEDVQMKLDYAHANDLLEDSLITNESVSRPRFVEIYRIDSQPDEYRDFENTLVATLDLKEKGAPVPMLVGNTIAPHETFTYTNDFYDQKIKTNKKYYYLFRILNEQRTLSHLSEIYEAELINDGGFNYSLFDVFFQSDLIQNSFVEPSKNVKKLLQLQPNIQHLTLDTTDIDFEDDAFIQLNNVIVGSAEDLIWGKTFKVRLTSKKTGKKIDLNITYNLNSEI